MSIFTSRASSQDNRIGPVFLSVCLSVSTLKGEPFDLCTQNLMLRCTVTISWMSLMVKVKGQ